MSIADPQYIVKVNLPGVDPMLDLSVLIIIITILIGNKIEFI